MVGSTLFAYATGIPDVLGTAAAAAAPALQGAQATLGAGLGEKAIALGSRFAGNVLTDLAAGTTNWAISAGAGIDKYDQAIQNGAGEKAAFAAGVGAATAEYFSNKLFSGTPLENSPEEKGLVYSRVKPPITLASIFCSARDTARVSTLARATIPVTSMPREDATVNKSSKYKVTTY